MKAAMRAVKVIQSNEKAKVKANSNSSFNVAKAAALAYASIKVTHTTSTCHGEDCAIKWRQSIIGERYECVSCKQEQRSHTLCKSCYQNYPYKSRIIEEDDVQAEPSTTTESGKKISVSPPPNRGNRVEHEFQCVSSPVISKKNDMFVDLASNTRRNEEIVKSGAEFNQIEFVLLGILLYPLGVLNLLLHRLLVKRERVAACRIDNSDANASFVPSPKCWYLNRTQHWEQYFSKLPWISVGLCLILNVAAVMGINAIQSCNGFSATGYWIYVYELFFVQSLTAQVQLFMMNVGKRGIVQFIINASSGFSFIEQCTTLSIGWENVYSLALSRRDPGKIDSYKFVFPPPGGMDAKDNGEATLEVAMYSLDPVKNSLMVRKRPIWIKRFVMAAVATSFMILIVVVSIVSMDTTLMLSLFGEQIRLPEMTTYKIFATPKIASSCHDDDDQSIPSMLYELELVPIPTSNRGLPQLTLQFIDRHMALNSTLNASVQEFWYVDRLASTFDSIQLQILDNHNFIPLIVSFPNANCSSNSYISLMTSQVYPESLQGLRRIRDRDISLWLVPFYILIVAPSVVMSCENRAAAVFRIVTRTYWLWVAFTSLTDTSGKGGVWSIDHRNWLRIDFSIVQNCRAWYELRNLLCEITEINLGAAIPMLSIAVVQFVVALAGLSWYAVLGEAPIPGFAYLICLCVNSLMVLLFIVPLTLIWRIQCSHIGLIAEKICEVEMLPMPKDLVDAQERQHASRVLIAIKTKLEANDDRVAALGFELSPSFLWTLTTFAATAVSFLFGSNIEYYVAVSHKTWTENTIF